ncbi:general stress protein [Methylobacterium sp. J-068]|uniref:general stress protein n=1 Tax=Methylobacterium sp. J-068 TaxID=2836649 RepID=UPI001FB86BD7|nr:general stress protein [Methylobacterium sp. J-068]MCJ2033362.1 hypothetical protein [Methylobacterium sp. J-068]
MAQQTITALYDDYEAASTAVTKLEAAGIPHSDISIVSNNEGDRHAGRLRTTTDHDDTTTRHDAPEKASTGAGTGATLGTVLGGAAGLLTGLGLLAIPGVGPVVAAGWLVATVTGAGIGAAAGGLAGGLTGAGLSEGDAQTYSEGVRRGGTLVTVRADQGHAARVMDILEEHGSIDIDERAQNWRAEGWTAPQAAAVTSPDAIPGNALGGTGEGRTRVRSYPNTPI